MKTLNESDVNKIFETYKNHGWTPYLLLLTDDHPIFKVFSGIQSRQFETNAVWFKRDSKHDKTAYELRLLISTPVALLETFPNDGDSAQLTLLLNKTERKILETAKKYGAAGN